MDVSANSLGYDDMYITRIHQTSLLLKVYFRHVLLLMRYGTLMKIFGRPVELVHFVDKRRYDLKDWYGGRLDK